MIKENEFNRAVVKYLDQELKRCGFRTLLVAPTDQDTPLADRTNLANSKGADLYVSCHYNAGGGEGVECYHYPGSSKGSRAANLIHKYVIQGTKQRNRGVKSANFHVLRETKMPAVLIEYGFMDDPRLEEAKRMIDPAFQKECAVETAKGVCEYFGVKYVPEQPPAPKPMYRVTVDGKPVIDTAYEGKILDAVSDAIKKGAKEIMIKPRE
ncbi:N-acetylmuramoyl-L-alanine amidase [Paenactinomyces guangxiensis]|uniref:N-acetylmuramoyl-L-alanine amidase n=1 Tax=Paenactinomyces guangxiensis TaxID=1490290 RepID=A0A7W2A8Y3_9BACL|nr:N-acetylmuramoyl-L-alanine amidase [Paenactinomyces guangxiensis]MBH8591758.1 N-acetylmuramoyl-L-alanine amidase [Paenactinomyces guangxiensis]